MVLMAKKEEKATKADKRQALENMEKETGEKKTKGFPSTPKKARGTGGSSHAQVVLQKLMLTGIVTVVLVLAVLLASTSMGFDPLIPIILLLLFGAFVFAWQIRYPKAKTTAVAKEEPESLKGEGLYAVKRWFTKSMKKAFPEVTRDLKRAGLKKSPEEFILQQVTLTVFIIVLLTIVLFLISSRMELDFIIVIPVLLVFGVILFVWMLQYPRVMIVKRQRDLDKDVLYAGRDILIALKSGVPLFNAMVNVSTDYGVASEEFSKIVEKINSGMPAEVALQEASDMNTSKSFRRIILQVVTSMRSGSDIAAALEVVLNQISREQVIELKRYGQKLNPLTMFYMLFGIIMPSLGIAVGIVLTSFVAVQIDFAMLMVICLLIGVVQYMFLTIIKSSRPNFEV